ncbi:MAG: hypothetical protein R3344_09635, partial [Acidobacteriota bacterium]|nr:hypothetical protein [Acidobacteriota bacterium]
TLASIIENEPKSMAELNRSAPAGLAAIVRRCLKKKPEARYEKTDELLRELRTVSAVPPRESAAPPPIPPVPQSPEPDAPAFGQGLTTLVGSEISQALGEVSREIVDALHPTTYHIQSPDGKRRSLDEDRLRKLLRRDRYSGDELIRRDGESEWIPLHESELFRQEVPLRDERGDARRRRKVGSLLQHMLAYVGVGVGWFFALGEIPEWMAFWGIGLAVHTATTIPHAFVLWQRRRELLQAQEVRPETQQPLPALRDGLLSQSFRDEVTQVKDLLTKRSGEEGTKSLIEEVDRIVERMTVLATMRRDLSEQTSASEREQLAGAIAEAEKRLAAATGADDQRLYRRQLEVLREREEAIQKALAVIDRAAVRQNVAEQQIKQLRLDLSREEASSASVPELTSRLQDIRHEVDAAEMVDRAIARELLS